MRLCVALCRTLGIQELALHVLEQIDNITWKIRTRPLSLCKARPSTKLYILKGAVYRCIIFRYTLWNRTVCSHCFQRVNSNVRNIIHVV